MVCVCSFVGLLTDAVRVFCLGVYRLVIFAFVILFSGLFMCVFCLTCYLGLFGTDLGWLVFDWLFGVCWLILGGVG